MVDSENEIEFEARYQQFKMWPDEFVLWIETSKGRKRPLIESMKKCMIKSVRSAAGLGDPPNKWVNTRVEALNAIIKESIDNNAVDLIMFLERIQTEIFKFQMDEIIKAIHSQGEYRLCQRLLHKSVNAFDWSRMTSEQRSDKIRKILKCMIPDISMEFDKVQKLSFPFNECPLLSQIPSSSFRNIYTFAEYVSNSCQLAQFMSGLTVIFDGEKTINVQKSFGKDKLMWMSEIVCV